jgi:hypothetical protein
MLAVNAWKLQTWIGHTDLKTTMRYTHVAETHAWPTPAVMLAARGGIGDPDRQVLAMLGARSQLPFRGTRVALEVA